MIRPTKLAEPYSPYRASVLNQVLRTHQTSKASDVFLRVLDRQSLPMRLACDPIRQGRITFGSEISIVEK